MKWSRQIGQFNFLNGRDSIRETIQKFLDPNLLEDPTWIGSFILYGELTNPFLIVLFTEENPNISSIPYATYWRGEDGKFVFQQRR